MKNRKPSELRQTLEADPSNWSNSSSQIRQTLFARGQAKSTFTPLQHESPTNRKFPSKYSQYVSEHLRSSKYAQQRRMTNQRYFKKDRSEEGKNRMNEQTLQERESRADEKKKKYAQITQGDYIKLNDKLNTIQKKISDMKLKLQKKKEEKKKRHQDKVSTMKAQKQKKQISISVQQDQIEVKQTNLKNLVTQVPQHQELHSFEKNPYSPRHNIYYVSEIVRAYKDEGSIAREHLQTTLQIMQYFQHQKKPNDEYFKGKKLKLSKPQGYEGKKTVVFDLDETLIHCNENLNSRHDVKLPIVFPTGEVVEAGINIRPYAKEIRKNLSKKFEVIIFTASHSCYANVVLDHLDPQNQYIHHRLFREHCYSTPEGMHIKDLRILDRDLSELVLVDNAAYSFVHQLDNGIPIIPYYRGEKDYELKALQRYVQGMQLSKDVRLQNRSTFKLFQYHKYYREAEKLVEDLYLVQHS